ncbi:sugar transferase [Kitasatospora herbaricolor]|uniref:Sugar transferase n=1 Tax=Kitasatospora herbaricolor TaxID=68217 RepID=A0ABZ1WFW9_9ACTN|nr:sugar transferase [Kitasatospora herbaricolor]
MKRAGDLAITALAGITALPLGLLIALLIRCGTGGPALVRLPRSGRHGRPFEMLTFRTTGGPHGPDGPDPSRATRLGALLRRTGLEQLPQLWNVARGEMAVIGPRPVPPEQAPPSSAPPRRRGRLDVRPGLTGWAQVSGRGAVTRSQRLALDLWYVEHRSLRLDLRILALTVKLLLRPDGGPAAVPAARSGPAPTPPAPVPPPRQDAGRPGPSGRE